MYIVRCCNSFVLPDIEYRPFRVSIEFSLEHPFGGIQFVIPKGEGTMAQVRYSTM